MVYEVRLYWGLFYRNCAGLEKTIPELVNNLINKVQ